VPEDANDTTRRDHLRPIEDVADRFRFRDDRSQSSPDLEKLSHDVEKSSHDREKSFPVLYRLSTVLERSLHVLVQLRADRFGARDDVRKSTA
jgi:hypothetical protein